MSANQPVILLVDDEEYIRELIGAILAMEGFHVIPAGGMTEAIAASRTAERIDLVISEIIMHGGSGPEMVEEIRHYWPSVSVLYINGFPYPAYSHLQLGAPVLEKPFTPKVLTAKVKDILAAAAEVKP